MAAYLTLTRRELSAFFLSVRGYVAIGLTTLLIGLSFINLMSLIHGNSQVSMPITEIFCNSWFWFVLLFSSPVITMRLFALEKSSGTFETLMTAPISDLQVVLAKFTAACFFYAILWLPLLASILVLRFVARDPSIADPGTLFATFLGIMLLGALYMAMGCLASALTQSQIVAAMVSFALGLGLFIVGYLVEPLSADQSMWAEVLGYMSMRLHMMDFSRGVIDTRYIVFYVSLTAFFLILTYRVVESRRWK